MASNSETGHAKNVALFKDLINICASFGEKYKPSSPGLQIDSLNTTVQQAEAAIEAVNKQMPLYTSAVAAKDNAFEPLNDIVTRAQSAYGISGAEPGEKNAVRQLVSKIKGQARNRPKKKEGEPVPPAAGDIPAEPKPTEKKTISQSRMSMDMRIEHLSRLAEIFAAAKFYKPNETELGAASLKALAENLKALSEHVIVVEAALLDVRLKRNKILYDDQDGLVNKSLAIKEYVRSVFGNRSPQHKRITGLKFARVKQGA